MIGTDVPVSVGDDDSDANAGDGAVNDGDDDSDCAAGIGETDADVVSGGVDDDVGVGAAFIPTADGSGVLVGTEVGGVPNSWSFGIIGSIAVGRCVTIVGMLPPSEGALDLVVFVVGVGINNGATEIVGDRVGESVGCWLLCKLKSLDVDDIFFKSELRCSRQLVFIEETIEWCTVDLC
jgi:hypothetical protein